MKLINDAFGPAVTNTYLVIDESTNYAIAIDVPPGSLDFILSKLEENHADLKEIWLTHTHWDHTGDVRDLKDKTGAEILVSKKGEKQLKNPNKYKGMMLPFDLKPADPDKFIKEDDELIVGHQKFRVLESPGHTEDGLIFVNDEEKVAFVGDTIFMDSIGRTDLPGGNFEILMNSIKNKVLTLPNNYTLYSGHGPQTTVKREANKNPFILRYLKRNGQN